ncbi:MOSC domain-containing protein [Roseiterribacter gracilis]|uniref:Molybdenum cofactor sulfurase related protein n=1 Tax=Roseiterribacter gracilis TaxID=2812848 RepID=A0A8S8XCV7_9PROT|nr:molybdenum cofactor sulfurase related protein [Rhodospirillales bacterium TMPK1]
MIQLQAIQRFPIKGLSPERLDAVQLTAGGGVPGDRRYALAHGETQFDPAAPVHLSKTYFLTLMTHRRLAELQVTLDEREQLRVTHQTAPALDADLTSEDGRRHAEAWFDAFIGAESKGKPRLVTAPTAVFTDIPERCVSVQNLASIEDAGSRVGAALDPLRFRANLHLAGLEPWQENNWPSGHELQIGTTRLRVMRPIVRCAAINVNPADAQVDLNLPKSLRQLYGANVMGFYAAVLEDGALRCGDRVEMVQP